MINKFKISGAIVIFLLVQAFSLVYAQGGEQASSPGISGQKPLNLLAVTLVSGGNVQDAADIPLNPEFKVQFDKNVVNSLIWGNNSKCFSIIATNGENIPVSVTKVDDTIDVSQRQNIFVQPVKPLSPGTAYYLNISPELKAKNGVTIGGTKGEGISVAFKTEGEAAEVLQKESATPVALTNSVVPEDLSSSDNQQGQQTTNVRETGNLGQPSVAVVVESSIQDADDKPVNTKDSFNSRFTIIGIFLVAGWIGFEILNRRIKNRTKI